MPGEAIGAVVQAAQIANDAFQSSQDRKVDQANLNLIQQKNYEQAQQDRAKLLLDQQKGERIGQSDAYRKALTGALGGNIQDVGYSREGGYTGGLRPSALGAEGRTLASILGSQSMEKLIHPEARPELSPYQRFKIGDQQAYGDPTIGKKPGFWAKFGYALNPAKWDNLKASGDPNYRKPGSMPVITNPGPLDPQYEEDVMGFLSAFGMGGGDVAGTTDVAPAEKRSFGRQLRDELLGGRTGPKEDDPYAGKNPFARFGSQLKDDLTGEGERRIARNAQLQKMLGGPFTMGPQPVAEPTAFDLSQRNRA